MTLAFKRASPNIWMFLLLLGFVLSGCSNEESRAGELSPCPSTQPYHNCHGTATNGESKYVGEWRDGEPNGQGTLSKGSGSDGWVYIGEFKNNRFHGDGIWSFYTGTIIEGEFKDGDLYKGKETYSGGTITEGEYRDGMIYKGTYISPDGEKFVGDFKDGEMWTGVVSNPAGVFFRIKEGEPQQ
jgi:hypothetical protein